LDKKVQFKFERTEPAVDGAAPQAEKPKEKGTVKGKAKGSGKAADQSSGPTSEKTEPTGDVKLLVRLYFSGHEKLSHQRWLDRIPAEEPFKSTACRTIKQDELEFAAFEEKFQNLG